MNIKEFRDIYVRKPLKLGHITQGSIFSGAISEFYKDCEVFGVVITARCSIVNKKLSSYHYLPIVNYNDWKNRDFKELLLEETRKKYINNLKEILQQNGQSPEIIGKFKYETIRDTLGPNINSKKQKKFKNIIDIIIELDNVNIDINRLISLNSKGADGLTKRLISHDLAGFYLIESWDKKDSSIFYVILLNEICVLKKKIFFQIGEGLLYEHIADNDITENDIINLNDDDMCYVNAQIKSPFTEHVLQRFHYNFGRIGVEDMHQDTAINVLKTNKV